MSITEAISELHQYCLENNLRVVYYHYNGHTRSVSQYINKLVNLDEHYPWIVIESLNMSFSPAQLTSQGWEEIRTRIDCELLTRTFS